MCQLNSNPTIYMLRFFRTVAAGTACINSSEETRHPIVLFDMETWVETLNNYICQMVTARSKHVLTVFISLLLLSIQSVRLLLQICLYF